MQPLLKDAESRMGAALEALGREFATVRTGRASTGLLDALRADYYGTPTPLNQMASISVPDARTLTIQPWEASQLKAIEKAIMASEAAREDRRQARLGNPRRDPEHPARGEPQAQSHGARQEDLRGRGAPRPRPDPEDDRQVHREGGRAPEEEGAGNFVLLAHV